MLNNIEVRRGHWAGASATLWCRRSRGARKKFLAWGYEGERQFNGETSEQRHWHYVIRY